MPRILVVDDDAVQLDLKKQVLEIAGYQVEIAFTASQTVRRLGNADTEIVMMDLRLPNVAGRTRLAGRHRPHTPDTRPGVWRSGDRALWLA